MKRRSLHSSKSIISDTLHSISDDVTYLGFTGRGDTNKTVLVPNKPGYVYVRIPKQVVTGTIEEYSEHIALSKSEYRHNMPVKVIRRKDDPSQYEILEPWIAGMGIASMENIMGSVTNHHWNHELYRTSGGHDPVMIDEAQIKNLQVTPTSPPSSSVIIGSGWYIWKDRIVHWYDGATLDLASSVPTGASSEVYVSLWLNPDDDTIHEEINSAIALAGFGSSIQDLVVWPDSDYIPLACVRLSALNYSIDWSSGKVPNIINMRPMHSLMPGDSIPGVHGLNPAEGFHSGSLDAIYVREEDPSGTYTYDNLHDILELELGPERARVKVSSDDTTADYLENKITSAGGVSISVVNPGGNEQLELFVSGTGGGGGGDVTSGSFSHNELQDIGSDNHHNRSHDHSDANDGDTLNPSTLNIPTSATPAQTADGQAVWDSANKELTVGDGTSRKVLARAELDNLGTTAINADLNFDTDNTYDVASSSSALASLWSYLVGLVTGSAPSTPASGKVTLYLDGNNNLRQVDPTAQDTAYRRGDYDASFQNALSTTAYVMVNRTIKANSLNTKGGHHLDVLGTIDNNSGAGRTYTFTFTYGATTWTITTGSIGSNASNRALYYIVWRTSSDQATGTQMHHIIFGRANNTGDGNTATWTELYEVWKSTSEDSTADISQKLDCASSSSTATQNIRGRVVHDGPIKNS